jgi:hypothetical protein
MESQVLKSNEEFVKKLLGEYRAGIYWDDHSFLILSRRARAEKERGGVSDLRRQFV